MKVIHPTDFARSPGGTEAGKCAAFVRLRLLWIAATWAAAATLVAAQTTTAPQLAIACAGENQVCLTWPTEILRPYQIETSTDVTTWAEWGAMQVGDGNLIEQAVPMVGPQAFYRVRCGAVRPGFDGLAMSRGDDHSFPQYSGLPAPVELGFEIRLFDKTYRTCYINNNGNITFEAPLVVYTPESLIRRQAIMIAPFWADVDSRNLASDVTRFSSLPGQVDGHPAFGVSWRNVGYFSQHTDKLNSFQLVLVERSDRAAGDFDIEFNYNQIQWETGDASGGGGGLGGAVARVGWTNGMGLFMEYRGSGTSLALLDQEPEAPTKNFASGLIYQMWNSGIPGRILIPVINGTPQSAPELVFQMEAGANIDLAAGAGRSLTLAGAIVPGDATGVTTVWVQESGPGEAVLFNPESLTPDVLIPMPGSYVFRLHGTKEGSFIASSSDAVTVTHPGTFVVEGGYYSRVSSAPLAVPLSDAYALFNESNVSSIVWTQIQGEKASILLPNSINPTVNLPSAGTYRFQCRASTSHSPAFVKTGEAVVVIAHPE